MSDVGDRTADSPGDDSVGVLVSRAAEQISELVREEMHLAQAEMTEKAKRFGFGGGLFGGAGVVAFIGLQALAAGAIAALALLMPVWASALIVAAVLLAVAAVLGAMGRKKVGQAAPPTPRQTLDSVKADVATIKEKSKR